MEDREIEVLNNLKEIEKSIPIIIVFTYAFDEEFEEVSDRVELYPLPQPILNAYKNWLPKQDEILLDVGQS